MRDDYAQEYELAELRQMYYEVKEHAALTHLDEEVVRRKCRKGEIPGAIKAGRPWLIPRCAIAANPTVLQAGDCYVRTVRTYVRFGHPFPRVPQVVATGADAADVTIPTVAQGSFSCQAGSPGLARWIACLT